MNSTMHIKSISVDAENQEQFGFTLNSNTFYYGDFILLQISVFNDDKTTPYDLTGFTFKFGMNNDFTSVPFVTSDQFISTDWTLWSLSGGQICCRVDTNSTSMLTYLDTQSSKKGYMTLWGYASTQPPQVLFQNNIIVGNRISVV